MPSSIAKTCTFVPIVLLWSITCVPIMTSFAVQSNMMQWEKMHKRGKSPRDPPPGSFNTHDLDLSMDIGSGYSYKLTELQFCFPSHPRWSDSLAPHGAMAQVLESC